MIENNPSNVSSGFEMLLEEVEAEIDFFTRIGSRAFENRDFRKVDQARERAQQVSNFRDKAAALRKEWGAVWLTQQLMAALFQTTKQNLSLHLQNIYAEVA